MNGTGVLVHDVPHASSVARTQAGRPAGIEVIKDINAEIGRDLDVESLVVILVGAHGYAYGDGTEKRCDDGHGGEIARRAPDGPFLFYRFLREQWH